MEVAKRVLRHECKTEKYHHDIGADRIFGKIIAPAQVTHNDQDYTERQNLANFYPHVERQQVG